jgi:hypothetical protein
MKLMIVPHTKKVAIALGVVLVITLLLLIAGTPMNQRKTSTPNELAQAYIKALKSGNAKQIQHLVPETHEATQEINRKIDEFKKKNPTHIKFIYTPSEFPNHGQITIRGETRSSSKGFLDQLYCKRINNRWFLVLGKHRNGIPKDIPETIPR